MAVEIDFLQVNQFWLTRIFHEKNRQQISPEADMRN